jgi:hypothetical protein
MFKTSTWRVTQGHVNGSEDYLAANPLGSMQVDKMALLLQIYVPSDCRDEEKAPQLDVSKTPALEPTSGLPVRAASEETEQKGAEVAARSSAAVNDSNDWSQLIPWWLDWDSELSRREVHDW